MQVSAPPPPRAIPADERVQRYERSLAMSVSSLKLAFDQLSFTFLQEKKKVWEDLLADKKLWKLARHQNPMVRDTPLRVHVRACVRACVRVCVRACVRCSHS